MSKSLNEYTEIGRRLVQKWGDLVENIDNTATRVNTAMLLENQFQKGGVINEETQSGQTAGGADWGRTGQTNPNDIAPFQHYLLPLVRRVYPNLMANELVGVQPMTSPTSQVFYLKYRYTGLVDLGADTTTGQLQDRASNKGQTVSGTEYGNFIGNTWNIDPYYSLQRIWRENLGVPNAGVGEANTHTSTLAASPMIAGSASAVVVVGDAATFSGSTNVVVAKLTNLPESTTPTVAGVNVSVLGVVAGTAFAPLFDDARTDAGTINISTATGSSQYLIGSATAADLGAFADVANTVTYDYDMEGNRQLPEIELEVSAASVVSQTRKLRTKWTIEASQDLRAMHNIDAEQELVALLSNEVTAEIDREIINDLIIAALIRVDYDYSNPFLTGGAFDPAAVNQPQGLGSGVNAAATVAVPGVTSFDDRNKALMYQILEVTNQIYRQSLRGAGNWIVTSPEVASKLESLLEFKPDAKTDFQYNLGIQYSGSVNGQFKVYKDPLFPRNLILVGYKGNTFMDAGFFYCPYVPLQLTPTVLDPESFNPRKGLLTRYGKVLVENGARMYGVITVNNLTAMGASGVPSLTGTLGVTDGVSDQVSTGAISDSANTDIDLI